MSKEVEALFERIVKDFADVSDARGGNLGDMAKRKLSTLVGKPAPEIEAEDIDGKKFKLSDYRGKVVLLDFWGNWRPPCRAMYPHERSLVKRLEGKAMGQPHPHVPVLLVTAVFSRHAEALSLAQTRLQQLFGPVQLASAPFVFNQTT
ncbi:MAG: TlpA family protein disulfide reductase [Gemmataceae bacterium]